MSNYLKNSQISAKAGPKQHSLSIVYTTISMGSMLELLPSAHIVRKYVSFELSTQLSWCLCTAKAVPQRKYQLKKQDRWRSFKAEIVMGLSTLHVDSKVCCWGFVYRLASKQAHKHCFTCLKYYKTIAQKKTLGQCCKTCHCFKKECQYGKEF